MPVDIKSGMGLEGGDDFTPKGKPKRHYALQLARCVYRRPQADGFYHSYHRKIFDSTGKLFYTNWINPKVKQPKSLVGEYEDVLMTARNILLKKIKPNPLWVVCAKCVCGTATVRRPALTVSYLSLIPELGRAKQDALEGLAATVHELAALDP